MNTAPGDQGGCAGHTTVTDRAICSFLTKVVVFQKFKNANAKVIFMVLPEYVVGQYKKKIHLPVISILYFQNISIPRLSTQVPTRVSPYLTKPHWATGHAVIGGKLLCIRRIPKGNTCMYSSLPFIVSKAISQMQQTKVAL